MKRVIIMIFVALFTITATNAQTSGNKRTQKTTTATRPNKPKPQPKPSPNPKPSSISKSKQITTPSSTPPNRGYINGHEWVDLGLSVKWATYNVGASSSSDYGNYFAWGETYPKAEYTSETHKYKAEPTKLDYTHDAATVNWGAPWRMPTKAECEELIEKCKLVWTKENAHFGYTIIGPNGNSIFLPASGVWDYRGKVTGDFGNYWTSSLWAREKGWKTNQACRLCFSYSSKYKEYLNILPDFGSSGLTIRPVAE